MNQLHYFYPGRRRFVALAAALALGVQAQNLTVTPGQRATAEQVAQGGVPLSELAPGAPDSYSVKRGDTLWAIAGMFLKTPWRWPELWGMNLEQVRNPHRIYPGQQLVLERSGGLARLRFGSGAAAGPAEADGPVPTVRVSPRVRITPLANEAIPTLPSHLIEPFLAQPLVVEEAVLTNAPRIVATQEGRVILSRGDRAYARGPVNAPLTDPGGANPRSYRVFRNAKPLREPGSLTVLAYEAQYLGRAVLVRSETPAANERERAIPGTIDIVSSVQEMRVGDRLLPEPAQQLESYVPRAPEKRLEASVISMYGEAVANAAQSQIVVLNKGTRDGVEAGHVLALLKDGANAQDTTNPARRREPLKLPDERNGLLMVFRPFERVSYALILEIGDSVRVGDRAVNPR